MNKKNTVGGQMWTPEYQQQINDQVIAHNELDDLEEIQDNPDNIRYYKPDQKGYTYAPEDSGSHKHVPSKQMV